MSDRRKTGEGGVKGWATRRQNGTDSPRKLRAEIARLKALLEECRPFVATLEYWDVTLIARIDAALEEK